MKIGGIEKERGRKEGNAMDEWKRENKRGGREGQRSKNPKVEEKKMNQHPKSLDLFTLIQ